MNAFAELLAIHHRRESHKTPIPSDKDSEGEFRLVNHWGTFHITREEAYIYTKALQ